MSRATLVATLRSLSRTNAATDSLEWKVSDWLEIRADLMPEPDPAALRSVFAGRLFYSLRSCRAGGKEASSVAGRCHRLGRAARTYDLIDLEGDRDLLPDLLSCVCPGRRVISWYGKVEDQQGLQELL